MFFFFTFSQKAIQSRKDMFNSLAALAITCADPVPVPPPIPAVIKAMFAPCNTFIISFKDSSAAAWPISNFEPAPNPLVKFNPI